MEGSAFDVAAGTGPMVQAVLVILILSSVMSWTVIFAKWMSFRSAAADTGKFLDLFWNGSSLDKIFSDSKDYTASPVTNVFRAGYIEFQKVTSKAKEQGKVSPELAKVGVENLERTLRKSAVAEILRLEKWVPSLASIASVAPFIGLFGTVWGIMNAFQSFSAGGPATLQRVGPGISEALIATAVGLAAAIPAVVAYNYFVNRLRSLRTEVDSFSSDFTNIIERNYIGN